MIERSTAVERLLAIGEMPVCGEKKENEKVASAGRAMSEILGMPDNIPSDLLQKAECAIGCLRAEFAWGLGGVTAAA